MDELVEVSKKLRARDQSYAAVILDFKLHRVEKAHLDGVTLPRNYQRIRDYYFQHYQKLIGNLEAINPPPQPLTPDTVPESN